MKKRNCGNKVEESVKARPKNKITVFLFNPFISKAFEVFQKTFQAGKKKEKNLYEAVPFLVVRLVMIFFMELAQNFKHFQAFFHLHFLLLKTFPFFKQIFDSLQILLVSFFFRFFLELKQFFFLVSGELSIFEEARIYVWKVFSGCKMSLSHFFFEQKDFTLKFIYLFIFFLILAVVSASFFIA